MVTLVGSGEDDMYWVLHFNVTRRRAGAVCCVLLTPMRKSSHYLTVNTPLFLDESYVAPFILGENIEIPRDRDLPPLGMNHHTGTHES